MKKKRKKSEKQRLKEKAWKLCSEYIRRKYADFNGFVKCCTCPTTKHWKEMQAGHYVDGHNNTVMFDEMLTHPQCIKCNLKLPGCLAGNKIQYTIFMMKKYDLTIEQIEEIENRKFKTVDCDEQYYKDLINIYKHALEEMPSHDRHS